MSASFIDAFLAAFITLFVIVDPPGIAPVFASLTQGAPNSHKRAMAIKGSMVATILLVFFAFVGDPFLSALGISLDALRIAGGILLFVIGFEMVMEKRTENSIRFALHVRKADQGINGLSGNGRKQPFSESVQSDD